ncbi:MAG: F0F1 ATP synthase subunit gamma [Candidatus Daviesbacteria bacterium]|nr:F0F1 ATP synthase subunit gamma [Candidatus Daviesbacteria bacterium]
MTIREIDDLIKFGDSLKVVAQAYGEIASIKIKKIRTQVEKNRLFFREIADVYRIVKLYASQRGLITIKHKQTLSILITSNQGFYGGIDTQVIGFFLDNIVKFPSDKIVIGKTGREYLKEIGFNAPFQSVEFKDDLPNPQELISLTQIIGEYKQALVFYPQLATALVQKPAVEDITQSFLSQTQNLLQMAAQNQKTELDYFIFEPELIKILSFFDNQILNLLLQQTFLEAEVARTASRLLAMDQAQREADNFISDQKKVRSHILKDKINNRLLEIFSYISSLRKEATL